MKRIAINIALLCLLAGTSYAMDLESNAQIDPAIKYATFIPKTPERQSFDALATSDFVNIFLEDGLAVQAFYLKDHIESDTEHNKLIRSRFIPAGKAYSETKKELKFEHAIFNPDNNWLELTYSYITSSYVSWIKASEVKFSVKTKIPADYQYKRQKLSDEDFVDLGESIEAEFISKHGAHLSSEAQKALLVRYSGLIPLEQYRSSFNIFKNEECRVVTLTDPLNSTKTRKVSFSIYGGEEARKDYSENIRPSETSIAANFSFLELSSINIENNNLVLEYRYFKIKSQKYKNFKVYTSIPAKYPNEDLSYMPPTLVEQKVSSPINAGKLAGLNARDLGKIFDDNYSGLILRSQYLTPEQMQSVNDYVIEAGHSRLETSMNLNIHGFAGNDLGMYSMEEIAQCKTMGLKCLHPFNQDPALRCYVDGEDPRTIPKSASKRGNVYNNQTIMTYTNAETRKELGLSEAQGLWGFGEGEDFSPAELEGNVLDLLGAIKNFLQAGLPGVFHCRGGIHRTGQVEALFILMFASRDKSLAMWSSDTPENLNTIKASRYSGYFSDIFNSATGRSDKGLSETLWASWTEQKKVTPIEWNYVLSAQGMPRHENIEFIRDFGRFARVFDELMLEAGSAQEAYAKLCKESNMQWVSQEIFMQWHQVLEIFNDAINKLST